MKANRSRLCTALVVAALTAALLPAAPGQAAPFSPSKIATHGFGDARNSYAWSMAWFKGKLYVGTARSELCVENATLDFYFPDRGYYTTNPMPDVTCPANRYDLDLRAEVWEYTPGTHQWRLAFRSPVDLANPRAPGKRVARDIGFRGMQVYDEPGGRQALYVVGVSADEYIPELAVTHPPRILRTADGRTFRPIAGSPGVIDTMFGPQRPIGYRATAVYQGRLFVTASGGLTGDGVILEVKAPWSAAPTYKQISPQTMAVFEVETFNGHLYAGAGDARTGYSVWRTDAAGTPATFTPIVTAGAGRGTGVTSVVSMKKYQGRLYVGASGWYSTPFPASELIRINADDSWSLVVGNARTTDDGQFRYPLSGLPDGFGSPFNAHFWRMEPFDNGLYLGTNDWSYTLRTVPGLGDLLSPLFGFDVYGSCDGQFWWTVTTNAFDDGLFNFGARTLSSTSAGIFLGSTNHAQGTSVWRYAGGSPCSTARSVTASEAAGTQVPTSLMASDEACGTALGWDPSPGATKYVIERAPYAERAVAADLQSPPPLPNGFRPELLPPAVASSPAGPPSSLSIPGSFVPVGTSTGTSFVDRHATPGARYLYRVVALRAAGVRSQPSNIVAVPAQAPQPTIERVRADVRRLAEREDLNPAVEGELLELVSRPAERPSTYAQLQKVLHGPALAQVRDSAARDVLADAVLRLQRWSSLMTTGC
jgi:hypothetical protein